MHYNIVDSNKLESAEDMKKRIAVITDDFYLFQKIRLTLGEPYECVMREQVPKEVFDILIADIDYMNIACDLSVSRQSPCDLNIPFTYGELLEKLSPERSAALTLSAEGSCAILRGRKIKLTELEYSLLSYLIKKEGYADKGELLLNVFNGVSNEGIINVYIHYLREKLERDGEKIIICSRGNGYKIDEKYLKGEFDA